MSSTGLNFNATLGCTFIGILFEILLQGFSCAQTLYYFHEYWSDNLWLRALVAFLWLLDTARTALDIEYMWLYIVTNHANPAAMEFIPITFAIQFLLSSVTVLVVQLYFMRAIWRFLPGNWYRIPLIGSLAVIVLLSFAGGCASVGEFMGNLHYEAVLAGSRVTASIQTVTAFVADVYIAVALSVILYGKKTGFSNTDTLVSRLVTYAIHRGLFTALLQLLHFATYIGTLNLGSRELIWSLFHFPASKVYVNSLLALLNVRHWLREAHYAESVHLHTLRGGIRVQRTGELWASMLRTDPGVLVTTETQVKQDEEEHHAPPPRRYGCRANRDTNRVA
ncbi:uncharacterized protein B0H18DRAFT_1120289 [Fomitopsis serialis]|uniref:uncharacterized protein n=1 Tax=Fomitopsis serialis TaxID=139415 RepID=UPI0020086868|nr:uncharacterized protein B0H18DRAFT_1120289 [Neoantrodia serialis]KAH9923641.1 hypothetical protein B0H18DRAFT_1120289 [Neoantrodia serialis]